MWLQILAVVVPIVTALVTAVYFVFFRIPKLDIEIVRDGGSSMPKGISSLNDPSITHYVEDIIYCYEVKWKIIIKIRNNSEYTAFYPKLYFSKNSIILKKMDKLNRLEPIKATELKELKAEIVLFEEKTGKTRTNAGKLPTELSKIKLLLEYKNIFRIKYYTIYDFQESATQNKLRICRPKEYINPPISEG